MTRKRHGFRIFALAFLATASCLGAIAAGAQAGPQWQIQGTPLTALQTILSTNFLATVYVPFYGYAHIVIGHTVHTIHPTNPGTGNGRTAMSKGTWLNAKKEEIKGCTLEPFEVVFKDKLIVHNGQIYDVFEAEKEGALMTLVTKGELCALPEKITVTGSFAYPIPAEAVKLTMKPLSEATETLIGVGLTAHKEKAFYTAEPTEELVETNVGKTWGAK